MPPHNRRSVSRVLTFDDWWAGLPAEKRQSLERYRTGLLKAFLKPQRSDLRWWYEVGTYLVKLFKAGNLPRAPGLMELIADKVEPGRDPDAKTILTRLYQFRELTRKYSRPEVDKLAKMVRNGEICLQHVANLLTVTDANTKSPVDFLTTCVENRWTANELYRKIQDDKHDGLESRGGRRTAARPTSNPAVAARMIVNRATALVACYEAYFQAVRAPLKKCPRNPSKLLLRELQTAVARLQEARDTAGKAQSDLGRIVREAKVKVQLVR